MGNGWTYQKFKSSQQVARKNQNAIPWKRSSYRGRYWYDVKLESFGKRNQIEIASTAPTPSSYKVMHTRVGTTIFLGSKQNNGG